MYLIYIFNIIYCILLHFHLTLRFTVAQTKIKNLIRISLFLPKINVIKYRIMK